MSDSGSARPRQLTLAGWFVVAGSVMLVITVYSAIASLNSVETRDRVTDWLSTPTGQDLGLSVADALSGLRVALMVTGLCAAASAVLGFFVLQRHRGARIALSVIVVPILLANLMTAPLTGGLLGALIAAATVILWTGPARDWFAGRPVRQPAVPQTPRGQPAAEPDPRRRRHRRHRVAAVAPPVDLSTQRPLRRARGHLGIRGASGAPGREPARPGNSGRRRRPADRLPAAGRDLRGPDSGEGGLRVHVGVLGPRRAGVRRAADRAPRRPRTTSSTT